MYDMDVCRLSDVIAGTCTCDKDNYALGLRITNVTALYFALHLIFLPVHALLHKSFFALDLNCLRCLTIFGSRDHYELGSGLVTSEVNPTRLLCRVVYGTGAALMAL
jgi:hypothetical protein